ALLLCVAAVPQQRAHSVHLGMAGRSIAAAGVDLFHDGGSFDQRQPAAAVLLRDERREIAGLGQCRDELGRIATLAIEPAPEFALELCAKRADRGADFRETFGSIGGGHRAVPIPVRPHHITTFARPLFNAITSRSTTWARKLTTEPSRHISVRI